MTPEQLKASILQYAIQGKLVEQRPEEGTGEELYQQIQAEKQRLIKDGKLKKEKPLPQIAEDEIPFDIPDSWKWCRLGALTYNWGQKTPDNRFCYVDVGSVNNISHEEPIYESRRSSSGARSVQILCLQADQTTECGTPREGIYDHRWASEPAVFSGATVRYIRSEGV